jgi:hypothetical protein
MLNFSKLTLLLYHLKLAAVLAYCVVLLLSMLLCMHCTVPIGQCVLKCWSNVLVSILLAVLYVRRLCLATEDCYTTELSIVRLWRNECLRVFGDRLLAEV